MATLAQDFLALLFQRQAVHFDHVVEHAGEHAHDFLVLLPVEARLVGEGVAHEGGQVDRAQQAGAYGGSGCSPHGLVARIVSHHQLLFISLTRSIRMKPGSA